MKQLIKLTILSALFISCASKPPVWKDKYGIIHREHVDPDEIAYVKVVDSAHQIPGGCIRLRNIYLTGRSFKDWQLKTETAKMSGTHVLKQYYNGVSDIMGISYDCKNWRSISSRRKALNLLMRNGAIGELERRSYEKKKFVPIKDDGIPLRTFDENQ